ncbi:hypothetical protein NUACC21_33810 [Scytonema sp. NUACC21]
MKLDSGRIDFATQTLWQNIDFASKLYPQQLPQAFEANTWVKLLELPNPYSFDEALLLCQVSQHEWLAWIPDHGEATLNNQQFVRS